MNNYTNSSNNERDLLHYHTNNNSNFKLFQDEPISNNNKIKKACTNECESDLIRNLNRISISTINDENSENGVEKKPTINNENSFVDVTQLKFTPSWELNSSSCSPKLKKSGLIPRVNNIKFSNQKNNDNIEKNEFLNVAENLNKNSHTRNFNKRINSKPVNKQPPLFPSDKIDPENKDIQYIIFNKIMNKILFSQTRISDISKDLTNQEILIDELVSELFRGFKPQGAIEIVDNENGTFTSIDNRRLFASKKIVYILKSMGADEDFSIYVKVHKYTDELTHSEYARFKNQGNPFTWGDAIKNRMSNGLKGRQLEKFNNSWEAGNYGYRDAPRIMNEKGEVKELNVEFNNRKIKLHWVKKTLSIAVV